MSVAVEFDDRAVREALARLTKAVGLKDALHSIGALVESQTKRRIETGKKRPDGTPWAPWSDGYAAQRPKGKSLLRDRGGLLDSIQYQVQGDTVVIGSNLEYAAIHQLGGTIQHPGGTRTLYFRTNKAQTQVGNRFVKKAKSNFAQDVTVGPYSIQMPARPYLGLSHGDEAELLQMVLDVLKDAV